MPALGFQLFLLLLGHVLVDFYGSFYAPLVPRLREQLGLSLTMTSVLATIYFSMSNFMQPVFGALGERYGRRRIMMTGVLFAALGMSLLTLPGRFSLPWSASFAFVALVLSVGGMGVGMFHPCGAATAGSLAGRRRSGGLSIFMVGGNIGVMFAPLVIPWMVINGPEYIPFLAIPGIAAAVMMLVIRTPDAPSSTGESSAHPLHLWSVFRKVWPIHLDVVLRFAPLSAFCAMLPLYGTLCGYSPIRAGQTLAVFMFAGALGVMSGGFLTARLPGGRVVAWSELVAGLCLAAAPMTRGVSQLALLSAGGFLIYAVTPLQIANAQRRVPGSVGVASGIVMGLAYGFAALLLVPLGMLGDHFGARFASERVGLQYMLQISTVTLFIAAALAFFVKMPEHGGLDGSGEGGSM